MGVGDGVRAAQQAARAVKRDAKCFPICAEAAGDLAAVGALPHAPIHGGAGGSGEGLVAGFHALELEARQGYALGVEGRRGGGRRAGGSGRRSSA